MRRYRAPAEHRLTLGLHDLFEAFFQLAALAGIARQEDQPAAIFARGGKRKAIAFGHALQKAVWNLQQDAGTVTRVDFAAAGAAMIQIAQYLDGLLQDAMRFAPLDVHDEADPAGIVLVGRVVKALFRRQAEPATVLVAVHDCHRGHCPRAMKYGP